MGASMLIVADNEPESKNLFMVENDVVLLTKIKIPVIMISQQDAANILLALQDPAEKTMMSIDFPVMKSEVYATIKNILQIDDKRTYEYIKLYYDIYKDFPSSLVTNIIYKTVTDNENTYGRKNCIQAIVQTQS